MKKVLREMIDIYEPDGIDWMGFKLERGNPYTYHHINEKRKSGKCKTNNGAILTKKAHRFLNYLEINFPKAYEHYQYLFAKINNSGEITPDLEEDIYGMLLDIFYYQTYGRIDEKEIEKLEMKTGHTKSKKLRYINQHR